MNVQKITVVLADDHTIVRQGLRKLLEAEGDIEVVGEAETGREAVKLADKLKPHVVVMDIAMPLLNGLEATRQITKDSPRTKVLMLSGYDDDEYVEKLTGAGAVGYLLKQTAAKDLVNGIREAFRGNAFFSPSISRRLLDHVRNFSGASRPRQKGVHLTMREMEVLQLVAEGFSNKEISSELKLSVKTVEKHRQAVMDKLGIHHVAGLTRYAIAKGIIDTKPLPNIDASVPS
jgi:DNA-binding NarL/FixJ family response regulator